MTDYWLPATWVIRWALGPGAHGNFIQRRTLGKPTDVALGHGIPQAPDALARHPSQLYHVRPSKRAVLSFIFVVDSSANPGRRYGRCSGLFLSLLGVFRFCGGICARARRPAGLSCFNWLYYWASAVIYHWLIGLGLDFWMTIAYRRNGREAN